MRVVSHPNLPQEGKVDVDVCEEHVRKTIMNAMLEPRSLEALKEGLTTLDVKERRQWWSLSWDIARAAAKGEGENNAVKIVFQGKVPAPAHEDGPTRKPINVTATRVD